MTNANTNTNSASANTNTSVTVLVWPDNTWCLEEDRHQYMLDAGKSDDYLIVVVPIQDGAAWEPQVETHVQQCLRVKAAELQADREHFQEVAARAHSWMMFSNAIAHAALPVLASLPVLAALVLGVSLASVAGAGSAPQTETHEVLLLAVDSDGNPAFNKKGEELSWSLCAAQEDSCRQEEFVRQWRVSVPAGTHKVTLRKFCLSGKVLRTSRTFTIAGTSPQRAGVVAVQAPKCGGQ